MSKSLRYIGIGVVVLLVAGQLRLFADAITSSPLNAIVLAGIGVALWLDHTRMKKREQEKAEFLERMEQQERLRKLVPQTPDERYAAYVRQCEGWCPPMSRAEWDQEEGLAPVAPGTTQPG
ncbi:hypothetical protein [Magnetospirillum sp. 64-120]|uniref:hypothetical protein n=1 Tax=Magnetospirillum sp. 64-120 TaxID=1895778 RepID=UPI0009285A4C|nr:hypothetical protein [Magnetospirillum sp. 64-120]OJX70916.1 MAG: hypothetical protein BGO92_09955 [Magnetospirillum sp. 64-120]